MLSNQLDDWIYTLFLIIHISRNIIIRVCIHDQFMVWTMHADIDERLLILLKEETLRQHFSRHTRLVNLSIPQFNHWGFVRYTHFHSDWILSEGNPFNWDVVWSFLFLLPTEDDWHITCPRIQLTIPFNQFAFSCN